MKKGKDSLGDRMKSNYENRTRIFLPRRTYTLIRVDGKAFHTYTKGLDRPFDLGFIDDMDATAAYMCKNIQGAKLAFVQSDEISIVMTDFEKLTTDAWFDGNIQKIASVSASLATAKFNELRYRRSILENSQNFYKELDVDVEIIQNKGKRENKSRALQSVLEAYNDTKLATFDSRTYTIPSLDEVINYFIWRQQDTTRNSISSVAQNLFSAKELHGKNTDEMQEMCFQKGVNWNDFNPKLKRGRLITKETIQKDESTRTRWVSVEPPIFTADRGSLLDRIPKL